MYYRLPLCVINEPINFNADHLAKKLVDKKAPKEVIFKELKLRAGPIDLKLEVSNLASVLELK